MEGPDIENEEEVDTTGEVWLEISKSRDLDKSKFDSKKFGKDGWMKIVGPKGEKIGRS